jgi:hypothetical protein
MSISHRIVSWVNSFVTAAVLSFLIAAGVGRFWPTAKLPTFLFLFVCFVAGGIQLLREERRKDEALDSIADTASRDLPKEFRSVIPNLTAAQQVLDTVGPYSRVAGRGDVVAFEYDLPNGYAVLVLLHWPFQRDSKVRGIRMYFKEKQEPPLGL